MSLSVFPTLQRRAATFLLLALLLLSLSACGKRAATQAAVAAPAAAPVAAAQAAPAQIAMVTAPQPLSPQAYNDEFLAAGAAFQLIDVRTPEEFDTGHIAGAVNIPLQELPGRLGELSQEEPVVLYCRSGNRSTQAARLMQQAGFTGLYNLGGIVAWQAAGFPIE